MDNLETEMSQAVFEVIINKISSPNNKKKQFKISNGNKLGICVIEFRQHEFLKPVLNQIAHVYGGTDASLYIVHGKNNETFCKDLLQDWKNVEYIKYDVESLDKYQYADLCCTPEFYRNFKTEFILKMEWDSYIRKQIPEMFFNYAYVGAPWTGYPNDYPDNPHVKVGNKLVGNGGFSLRNVKRMIEICEEHPKTNRKLGEDVHITNCLRDDEIPEYNLAKSFSVEWVYHEDPVGLHKVWCFHPIEVFKKWFVLK